MTDKSQQLLHDRLIFAAGKHNKDDDLFSLLMEAVREIDRLSPQSSHIEVMKKDAQVEMRKEIEELKAANSKQRQVIDDWISHPKPDSTKIFYESVIEKQQKAIDTLRECLEVAELALKRDGGFGATLEIISIKKIEGGIE